MRRYWRIGFIAPHTSCWLQMGTLPLYWVECGQNSWFFVAQKHLFWWGHIRTHRQRSVSKIMILTCNVCMIFVLFSRYPSLVLPQCWKLNPTVKHAIVLIWDPSDDFHYNGWMARRCQKSKAGQEPPTAPATGRMMRSCYGMSIYQNHLNIMLTFPEIQQ